MKNNSNVSYENKNEKNDKVDIKQLYGKQCIQSSKDFIENMKINIDTGLKQNQVEENTLKMNLIFLNLKNGINFSFQAY